MALSDQVEFLETLGEGSFGIVCLARLIEGPLKRTVVLKILKEDWADDARVLTRARDEARLLALLNHDNIVKVERLETVGRKTIVVMEYVQGLSLDLLLQHHGPVPASVALQITGKVASALDAAFNRVPTGERRPLRVVHRDIKPSNIIISVTGGVKVLDFGTARGLWESREARTETNGNIGTLLYMSPEAFDGNPGPEVDVYALGSTLYELLSGVRLGRLSVRPKVHGQQRSERISQLSPPELLDHPDALAEVRALVYRCLSYEAHDRPSAAELRRLVRQVQQALPGAPIPLDLFGETWVEPLWRKRPVQPPPALDSTLDRVGSIRTELDIHPDMATRQRGATPPPPEGATPGPSTPPPRAPAPASTFMLDALPEEAPPPPPVGGAPQPAARSVPTPSTPWGLRGVVAGLGLLLGFGAIVGAGWALRALEPAPRPSGQVSAPIPPPPEAEPAEAPAIELTENPAPETEVEVAAPEEAPDPAPRPVGPKVTLAVMTIPAGLELSVDGGASLKGQRDSVGLSVGWHRLRMDSPEGTRLSCRFQVQEGHERLIAKLSGEALSCEGR